MPERAFDELNTTHRDISIPYEKYFGEMDLTKEQKSERISLARKLEDVMLFLFALIAVMQEYDKQDMEYAANCAKERMLSALNEYMFPDIYLEEYVDNLTKSIIDTTVKNQEDEWFLSNDRAVLIAENESNTGFNYDEYRQAVLEGKTRKQWKTEGDSKVRRSHKEVDGVTIGIDELFSVGSSLMRYPKDISMGAGMEEVANCRCTIKYL